MADDSEMRDADAVEEERAQYHSGGINEEDLDEKYPNRPHNHSKTLPFSDFLNYLFNPLNENKRKPTGPIQSRKKQGPNIRSTNPRDVRRDIVERFISRWRKKVGDDIYPAFRLIVPEKDRDRAMYGLKEKTIGKLLVRAMGLEKNSEDAFNLLNWKLPGIKSTSAMAGDFAGRCQEVIKKRASSNEPGTLTIGEVNEMLDKLSAAQKENDQLPIFDQFYKNMNADEMMWLIRMILRQMKVGASEKTIFEIWHPDAHNLFNVSSSLRRVCWELYDPTVRLAGDDKDISLMQCFQPQLAAFQLRSIEKTVARMNLSEDDPVFWVEEKLDGERMQLHMMQDENITGGFRFGFWSRKGKDYTYLYGNGFHDDEGGSLTKQIRDAFNPDVRNIILDGEMITWDPKNGIVVGFGSLKTAALAEQKDPLANGNRPLYRVFDCLYLNDQALTQYTLRDRRRALEQSVNNVHRRLEIHEHTEGTTSQHIESELQRMVANHGEGLVVKRPGSMYRLNERNEDWIKVKPEYMAEFGHNLDCVVIGGYYGSGHRGGGLSSFLCGLRLDDDMIAAFNCNPMLCYSFFKVGGGFTAADYADIWHRTDGKWKDWDRRNPPDEYIELGGEGKQWERPDVWIKPDDSVVLEVKASEVIRTVEYKVGKSLRFPRFTKLRSDKSWKEALSVNEFLQLQETANREKKEKQFMIDDSRKQRRALRSKKKKVTVLGADDAVTRPYAGPELKIFERLTFYIMTGAAKPINKTKTELEQLVKANGGKIAQTHKDPNTICVAEGNPVRVASVKKEGSRNIVYPRWLLDCIRQAETDVGLTSLALPYEPQHVLFARAEDEHSFEHNMDLYGDSFARDLTTNELSQLLGAMPEQHDDDYDTAEIIDELMDGGDPKDVPGWLFHGVRAFIARDTVACSGEIDNVREAPLAHPSSADLDLDKAYRMLLLCGGSKSSSLEDGNVTHVMVSDDYQKLKQLRRRLARLPILPRLVTLKWVTKSIEEHTRLDEERFDPV
ncbi:hypothetical protein BDV97DRAFT_29113 [Delphinella strobiligena]|nr:hypothetical protein BDV97DRAFT_29113 [Delphinella strobiligena]